MDYKPRHAQPFTLAEAVHLEIPIITEEIARLQNSLQHLERTQNELREHLTADAVDPVLEEAISDNSRVIASQEERITILKMALSQKGIPMTSHYDLHPSPQRLTLSSGPAFNASGNEEGDQGIDL